MSWNELCVLFVLSFLSALQGRVLIKSGRRICTYHGDKIEVVPKKQSYKRPFHDPECSNRNTCNTTRVFYRVAYRTVFYKRVVQGTYKSCCPGWTKKHPRDSFCSAPICRYKCQNGGVCSGPNLCECPPHFSGRQCKEDVDECLTGRHKCQQICKNTFGGYNCQCFDGFQQIGKHKCQFCPVCIPAIQEMMNKMNELQLKVNKAEQEKEEMRGNLSVLERHYNDAMSEVEELKSVTSNMNMPTTRDPYQFNQISSLSDQISLLEERIGSCDCREYPGSSRNYRRGRRSPWN